MGLIISGHTHLTQVARASGSADAGVHAAEKRLSRHLASPHWKDVAGLADQVLAASAAAVGEDSLIVVDISDLAKPYARKMEGLGRVRDASVPGGRLTRGYMILYDRRVVCAGGAMAVAAAGGGPAAGLRDGQSERKIVRHLGRIYQATGGQGILVMDRGATGLS